MYEVTRKGQTYNSFEDVADARDEAQDLANREGLEVHVTYGGTVETFRPETWPLDVWLKFDHEDDEEATHEANTFKDEAGYRVEWYLNSVGLVKSVYFDTLAEAHAWYEREGFQDFTS